MPLRRFTDFARDDRGAAAVELGLIMPFLAAVLTAIIAIAPLTMAQNAMHNAVATGSQYAMNGGNSPTAVHDVTISAWASRPSDGAVVVTQYCSCAGVQTACSTLCAGAAPSRYTRIQASMLFHGISGNQALATAQLVRTR